MITYSYGCGSEGMTFRYVSVEEAIARSGLRMVVVGGAPSPWGEAAKGIFHIKGLDWVAVRLVYDSEALLAWAKQRSGPVAIFDQESPRSGWAEILLLAERLAPEPALLPHDAAERAVALGLAHELLGEEGLAWSRRLQLVESGAFPEKISVYLGKKYGYRPTQAGTFAPRVLALLKMLSARLKAQRAAGSRYYVGDVLSAIDIYAATCLALFRPLPPEHCAMNDGLRKAFESPDPEVGHALDPILLEHRDMMYAEHLELPLAL